MDPRLHETILRWWAAEQRLYPTVMAWPEGYERYVTLVRAVADELRPFQTVEALAEAYAEGVEVAVGVARRNGLPTEGLDLELAVGAAFCLRYREVLAQGRRGEAIRRVGEARARGQEWVLVEETRPWPGSPAPPYHRVEMHLPEGTGLHAWVDESPGGEGLEYGVEVVQLDPETGGQVPDQPVLARRTFRESGAWKEAVEELRDRHSATLTPDEEGAEDVG